MVGLLSTLWFVLFIIVAVYYKITPGKQRGPLFAGFALGIFMFAPGVPIGPWVIGTVTTIFEFSDGVRTIIENAVATINLIPAL